MRTIETEYTSIAPRPRFRSKAGNEKVPITGEVGVSCSSGSRSPVTPVAARGEPTLRRLPFRASLGVEFPSGLSQLRVEELVVSISSPLLPLGHPLGAAHTVALRRGRALPCAQKRARGRLRFESGPWVWISRETRARALVAKPRSRRSTRPAFSRTA